MRLRLALLGLVVAACGGDEMPPVGGGGNFDGGNGGNSDSSMSDAHINDASGIDTPPSAIDAALIMGRVCLANDPRQLNVCSTTGAGGLTVRLGANVTTTAADGTFTITATSGTWRVTGANIVTSIMVLSDYEIPAITRASYDAMVLASLNPMMLNPGEGSVMVQVIRNGVGTNLGATATSNPTATFFPRYDADGSQSMWATDMTHSAGTVWIPGIDVGTVNVTVDTPTATPITDTGLPIVDGAITFTTIIFPT